MPRKFALIWWRGWRIVRANPSHDMRGWRSSARSWGFFRERRAADHFLDCRLDKETPLRALAEDLCLTAFSAGISYEIEARPRAETARRPPYPRYAAPVSKEETIQRLCKLLHDVWAAHDEYAHAACDCFCGHNGVKLEFRSSGQALDWIEKVVRDTLALDEKGEVSK